MTRKVKYPQERKWNAVDEKTKWTVLSGRHWLKNDVPHAVTNIFWSVETSASFGSSKPVWKQ